MNPDGPKVLYDQYGRAVSSQEKTNEPHHHVIGATTWIPYFPRTPNEKINSKKKWYKTVKGWEFPMQCGVFIAAIAAIATAVIYYFQLREMITATRATLQGIEVGTTQMALMQRQLTDSESQLRALLKVESFQIRRTTNMIGQIAARPGKYNVDVSIVIKNYGATAAIDLAGTGQTISERIEALEKQYGITNGLKRWNPGNSRKPQPGNGGFSIMPQETFTNKWTEGEYVWGDSFYKEFWLSYRDIFGRPWVIGEGGRYNFTNDIFTPEFIDWGKYHDRTNTNKNPN